MVVVKWAIWPKTLKLSTLKNNEHNTSPKVPKPEDKSYLKYSGLGLQLFITIGLFAWLGYKMDYFWNDGKPLYIIIMIFLGVIGGFYNFYKAVNQNNSDS